MVPYLAGRAFPSSKLVLPATIPNAKSNPLSKM
jgi:hypothetical protein